MTNDSNYTYFLLQFLFIVLILICLQYRQVHIVDS